jgi:hypothetical protein
MRLYIYRAGNRFQRAGITTWTQQIKTTDGINDGIQRYVILTTKYPNVWRSFLWGITIVHLSFIVKCFGHC